MVSRITRKVCLAMYIKLNDIHFQYEKDHPILRGCTASFQKSEIIAIIGNSGSGKSTLLRIISGLERANHGELMIEDEILFSDRIYVEPNKRNIGMVFQDYALFPHLKVAQNITYALHKKPKEEKKIILERMLELVSLTEKKDYYPHELSGGQQQRVALARSLAAHPKLLLLDEPFSNLDASLRKQIRNDLFHILRKREITCIFATHDLEDAIDIADTILYLEEGQIVKVEKNKQSSLDLMVDIDYKI
jgi:iron(III) transport system ATP-binding protein